MGKTLRREERKNKDKLRQKRDERKKRQIQEEKYVESDRRRD